jgi:hypothetical protein
MKRNSQAPFVFLLCLLFSLLGVLVSGFTQKSPAPLKVRDAVIKENAHTLRAKPGFEFVQEGKRIKVVERSTRRFVALSDGICGGGCSSCSGLVDANGKTICKGCNANPDCKLSEAF